MLYTGKQIIITMKDGEVCSFRGSAYTLQVDTHLLYKCVWVTVYLNGKVLFDSNANLITRVQEDNFSGETLTSI